MDVWPRASRNDIIPLSDTIYQVLTQSLRDRIGRSKPVIMSFVRTQAVSRCQIVNMIKSGVVTIVNWQTLFEDHIKNVGIDLTFRNVRWQGDPNEYGTRAFNFSYLNFYKILLTPYFYQHLTILCPTLESE